MKPQVLVKPTLALVLLALVAYLFASTLRNVGSEPYGVPSEQLTRWTIVEGSSPGADAPLLSLRPPRELPMGLFDQVFQRTMESYATPVEPGIPLVLRRELQDRSASVRPDALSTLAHAAGLGSARLEPRCMAVYRTQGGREHRVFFVVFELPQFERFRLGMQQELRAVDPNTQFEPRALAPALLVASSDPGLLGFVPSRAELEAACEAPVEAQSDDG